jgi:OPT oligopeptide transporter protein
MMLFKTWGYNTMLQALTFASDFKLGHYMKILHRPMFWCQIVATVVAGTVQLGVQAWMFSNIEDLCSPDHRDGFTCPYTHCIWHCIDRRKFSFVGYILFALLKVVVIVGRHRTSAYFLARSALPRPRLLLPTWRHCAINPVGDAQEVQDELPQIPQLPGYLFSSDFHSPRDAAQLRALGSRLLHLKL